MGGGYEVVLATPAPVSHRTAEENLGLGYLAAFLRREGYKVAIVDGWLEGLTPVELAERVVSMAPRLLGVACYRSNMDRAIESVRLIRDSLQSNAPMIVAGGYGPTFHAADFLGSGGFDAVVRGEGEVPLHNLVSHVATGTPKLDEIAGVSFLGARGEVVHHPEPAPKIPLDELPDPARDTLDLVIQRRTPAHVQTARGCQASCTFCSIVAFERVGRGATWRDRSIRRFVDELESLSRQGVTHVKVIDDSLMEPPRDENWARELADEIESRNLVMKLRGSIRADRVTEPILEQLRRAGFFAFSCGIENFAESALRRMAKRASVEQNFLALDIFAAHGYIVQAGHILFDDQTTIAELEENYRGFVKYEWTISKGIFSEMFAAAGTNFTRRLSRDNLLRLDVKGLGNSHYSPLDPAVAAIKEALRTWQIAHSRTYDKVIDPLSAPKVLEERDISAFHEIAIDLRRLDLKVFRTLLDLAASAEGARNLEISTQSVIADLIASTRGFHDDIEVRVEEAYLNAGLVYDADLNPFIC